MRKRAVVLSGAGSTSNTAASVSPSRLHETPCVPGMPRTERPPSGRISSAWRPPPPGAARDQLPTTLVAEIVGVGAGVGGTTGVPVGSGVGTSAGFGGRPHDAARTSVKTAAPTRNALLLDQRVADLLEVHLGRRGR